MTFTNSTFSAVSRPQAFDFGPATQALQDVAAFNKGTVEAFAQSSQTLIAGMQDLVGKVVAANQTAFSETLAGFKALAAAKDVKQGLGLQASLAQQSVERAITNTTQFIQASVELAQQAYAPLLERAKLAAETLTRRAA
jgi:hypothetical protein